MCPKISLCHTKYKNDAIIGKFYVNIQFVKDLVWGIKSAIYLDEEKF